MIEYIKENWRELLTVYLIGLVMGIILIKKG